MIFKATLLWLHFPAIVPQYVPKDICYAQSDNSFSKNEILLERASRTSPGFYFAVVPDFELVTALEGREVCAQFVQETGVLAGVCDEDFERACHVGRWFVVLAKVVFLMLQRPFDL